ncbi:MAG: LPS export ABC transporter periplasmic protein LptC [Gammaproteobacteria bacterium]|nr:LPS export ABC transporter periplasmic protein LptC [Gammaproteobacteria bacterium]
MNTATAGDRIPLPFLFFLGILLLASLLYWLVSEVADRPVSKEIRPNNSPDVEFQNLNMVLLSKDGTQFYIEAKGLSHFEREVSTLVHPKLSFRIGSSQWQIDADSGALGAEQKLYFNGEVQIQQYDTFDGHRKLQAAKAEIDLQRQILNGEGDVKVTMDGLDVVAASITVDLLHDKLALEGNVRGVYVLD